MTNIERLKNIQDELQRAANLLRDSQALRQVADAYMNDWEVELKKADERLTDVPSSERSKLVMSAFKKGCVLLAEQNEQQANDIQQQLLAPQITPSDEKRSEVGSADSDEPGSGCGGGSGSSEG